jgi:signal transduction histidine kinase
VVIRVEDTGPGLPADGERVFEPFFTTKQPGSGTGLGLAICREYLAQMGGTITAGNGPERGAIFTVRFPLQHASAAPDEAPGAALGDSP